MHQDEEYLLGGCVKKILNLFKRKKGPGAPLFDIRVKKGKTNAPAFTITSPKAKEQPAITIITPKEEVHPITLPEHHLSDAEALSQIVTQQPRPVKRQPPAEKPATIDQVVAVLKKKVRAKRPEATLERRRKKASRKTKHDKVIETIAKSTRKKSKKSR